MLKPIEKVPVTDSIVRQLTQWITSGEMTVGSKMPTEREIGERLQVGRSSVREAMRVLKAQGLVHIVPGKGAYVARTMADDTSSIARWFEANELEIHEFMEVRLAIETVAVRLAIQKGREADFRKIEDIHRKFCEAVHSGQLVQLISLDEMFHGAIVEATQNRLMMELYKTVAELFIDYRTKAFSVQQNAVHALEPHTRILEALFARDEAKAIKEVEHHIRVSIEDIEQVIHAGKASL